jgi:hypothetical protein
MESEGSFPPSLEHATGHYHDHINPHTLFLYDLF